MPRRALEWSDPRRPPTPREDHTGRVLARRFRLDAVLYETESSTLYRAHDLRGRASVAVKLLDPELDPARVERFIREGRLLARLRHPHIADFIDADRTPEGLLYIVTALIDGPPLVEWCSNSARLPAETICRIGMQVAEGLACLHAAGVIHRDVKASNIIWPENQVAKLVDLGLAKLTASTSLELTPPRHPTAVGVPIGTPGYMPPEAGEVIDARTDVFGLGRTLYRLLTHRPAQSWPEGLETVAEPLRTVIMDAGAPKADWRPATMEEFRGRLHAARAHLVPSNAPAMRPARHLWPVPADREPAPQPEPGCSAQPAGDPCTASGGPQLFERRLELRLQLREGRRGQTWRAYHHVLDCDVVVKIVPAPLAEGEEGEKLRREAAALQKLQHPAFPRVYECDSSEVDGSWYMLEEWIKGETFADMLKRRRPDLLHAVELVAEVAEALTEAHACGVVHGDVHPGNFMVEETTPPRARVIDLNECVLLDHYFALSPQRFAAPPHLRPPRRARPAGLTAFTAPEVLQGGRQTVHSDLYGLGCVLFALITRADVPATELQAIQEAGPRERFGHRLEEYLVDRLPDLEGSELLDVFDDVLAPEPERRALHMAGFAAALRTTAESIRQMRSPPEPARPPRAQVDPPAPAASPLPELSAAPPAPAAPERSAARPASALSTSRGRMLLGAASLGLVLVGVALGAVFVGAWQNERLEASAPAVTSETQPTPVAGPGEARPPAPVAVSVQTPLREPELEPTEPLPPASAPKPPASGGPRPRQARLDQAQTRQEPITVGEATAAVTPALARLRACEGAPKVLAAQLDVQRGRGKVSGLNFTPAANFGADSWEACVRRELERVRYPDSATASQVRLRLQL